MRSIRRKKSNIMCLGPADWKMPDAKENRRTNVTSSQAVVLRPRRTVDDSFKNNYTIIADDYFNVIYCY